jgi:biotin transporter BioY
MTERVRGFLAGVTFYPFPIFVPGCLAKRSARWLNAWAAGIFTDIAIVAIGVLWLLTL